MDLFISKIALKNEISVEMVYELIKKWIKESPHYSLELNYSLEEDLYKCTEGNLDISFLKLNINEENVFACHFENRDNKNIWVTDYIYVEKNNSKYIFITLSCKSDNYANKLPRQHKPHFIKMLINEGFCKTGGIFPIQDKVINLKQTDVDLCAEIMQGKQITDLPVVYVSMDPYNKDQYAVNVDRLAIKLSGLAHVIVEPNIDFSLRLKEAGNHCNPYNGYIGVYFPNSQYKEIISSYKGAQRIAQNTLENSILDIVTQACLNHANISDWSWNSLQIEYGRKRYEIQKKTNEETVREYKEWEDLLGVYEQEKEDLQNKVKDLQKQLDSKNAQLELLKCKCDDDKTLSFDRGDFIEFYTHELHDAIITAVTQCIRKEPADSRLYDILSQFSTKNPTTGYGKELLNDIKDALKEKSIDSRRRKLEKVGFAIEKGPHDKLIFMDDKKYIFVLSNSPSDFRECENMYSDIKKKLDIYKK